MNTVELAEMLVDHPELEVTVNGFPLTWDDLTLGALTINISRTQAAPWPIVWTHGAIYDAAPTGGNPHYYGYNNINELYQAGLIA